jgi:pentose-5-phosphate-3-epimerase
MGFRSGSAFNPETNVDEAAHAARQAEVDLALCMSVHPGYSGQAFIPESLERSRSSARWYRARHTYRSTAGVGPDNIVELRDAGAELFVAATAIFGARTCRGPIGGSSRHSRERVLGGVMGTGRFPTTRIRSHAPMTAAQVSGRA